MFKAKFLVLPIIAAIAAESHAATIIFADQFGNGSTSVDFNNGGSFTSETSAASPGNWNVTTSGDGGIRRLFGSGGSSTTFDADGSSVASTGNGFIALGSSQRNPVNGISRGIDLVALNTYTVYFLYKTASDNQPSQPLRASLTLGAESETVTESVTQGSYSTGSFTFTPTTSGTATLSFDDFGNTNGSNRDVHLDSVVVTFDPGPVGAAIPEPSTVLLCGFGALSLLRRRR